MRMNQNHYRNSGFTLVELVIIIVVMAILAGIAIMLFLGAGKRADAQDGLTKASAVAQATVIYNSRASAFPNQASLTSAKFISLPDGIVLSNALPTSTYKDASDNTKLFYATKGTAPYTGVCVGYWDPSTGSAKYVYSGNATTVTGTACS